MFLSELLCLPSNIKKAVGWSEKSGLWLWSQFDLVAERPQTDLASASMMLHLNDSVECSMEEIALKGKRDKPEPSDKAKTLFCFLSLSDLFPRTWYIQLGYSGDSCFK